MRAALDPLHAEITGVVKRSIVLRLYKGQFVEHGVAVARPIHQQLRSRIESNQKVLVSIVTGLDKVGQRVARAPHLVAAHRAGDIKEYAHWNRRIFIAEKSNVLLRLIVKDTESIFSQARNKPSVDVGHGHRESDQVGIGDDGILVVDFTARQ